MFGSSFIDTGVWAEARAVLQIWRLKKKQQRVGVLSAGEGPQDGVFLCVAKAGCEQRWSGDMDPMKAQQLAAELEVEMMADMYNR